MGQDPLQDAIQEKKRSCPGSVGVDWWALQDHRPPPNGLEGLCSMVWVIWVVTLVGGAALLMDALDVTSYAWFVSVMFFATKYIPDPGDSPAPYFLHLALPFFAIKGLREAGVWTLMNIFWAFILIPAADYVVGVDTFNKAEGEYKALRGRLGFRLSTLSFLPAQVCLITYGCYAVNYMEISMLELVGRMVCVAISYGHFYVEHNRGHHKMVATDEDPATARFDENFYSFLPRCVLGSLESAWGLEVERCRQRRLPFWCNEMLWYWIASSALCGCLAAAFGPRSIPLFLGQSFMGILLFESVNYIEHYGLERKREAGGRYEPVSYEHSWDSPHRLTNMVLFKLQRHGDHHVNSTKRYQMLRAEQRSPQLPMGYPSCVLLALCPPLWRAVMNPRVLALRRSHRGREWLHGPKG